ncbi:hypothetical protein OHT77_31440 [Streptomyces sp. NBC_00252]|nr:hypothetical protein [Streptomyces sp. NBC_00252]
MAHRHAAGTRTGAPRHYPDEMVQIPEKVLSLSGDDVSHLHGLL